MPLPDRHSNGVRWTPQEIAREVMTHYADWRGVIITAVILAESGGYVWIRPMVIKDDPTHPAHLSTDRGMCQFNSWYWRTQVPDKVAFDGAASIAFMCQTVTPLRGSWSLNPTALSWWNAYMSNNYVKLLSTANAAFKAVIQEMNQKGTV